MTTQAAGAWTGHNDYCAICEKHDYLMQLHGDKGGPWCCIVCRGKWHAEHGRRRRLGRIVIRAMAAYMDGGGKWDDIDKLKLSAMSAGSDAFFNLDPLGYMSDTAKTTGEVVDLTSELLADAIKIAHPDLHPPERQELAHRVAQGLLALVPFTFPASKPKPPKPKAPGPKASATPDEPPGLSYPCKDCADTRPMYYCAACKAEWDKRQDEEAERERAKRHAWYARRKAHRECLKSLMPPTICPCGAEFKGRRTDARFCSDVCRQRAHRKAVTDKTLLPRLMACSAS
jgi:hypothetical protein